MHPPQVQVRKVVEEGAEELYPGFLAEGGSVVKGEGPGQPPAMAGSPELSA